MEIHQLNVSNIKCEEHSQRFAIDEEKMLELVGSIRENGLLQPVTVKKKDEGFVLVFGHRRLEACKRLGWKIIPAIIKHGDEAKMRGITFAENFFSEDLSTVELAVAIADEHKNERMSIDRMAAGFNKSPDWVRRQISICSWPENILEAMHQGKISTAAASNLALITDDQYRKMLLEQAVDNGATARTTAAWLQAWRSCLPLEKALEQPPVEAGSNVMPLLPQAPCAICMVPHRTDALSYVPVCVECMATVRSAGQG